MKPHFKCHQPWLGQYTPYGSFWHLKIALFAPLQKAIAPTPEPDFGLK